MKEKIYRIEQELGELSGEMKVQHGQTIHKRARRRQRPRWATNHESKHTSRSHTSVFSIIAFVILTMNLHLGHRRLGGPCKIGVAAALTTAQRRAIALSRIKRGMLLSQEAKHNVTAAEEACEVWESVLSRPPVSAPSSSIITTDVLALSKTLYASCLVRVGRDSEAVSVYDSCLETTEFSHNLEEATKWRLAKARCLQRLLKYAEAAEEYTKVVEETAGSNDADRTVSAMGASTCILRSSGDVVRAREILAKASEMESVLLLTCLEYLETGQEGRTIDRLRGVLATATTESDTWNATTSSFLLYRWILSTLEQKHLQKHNQGKDKSTTTIKSRTLPLDAKDLFMELIRINTSPLDDPELVRLDDKIKLHDLLTTTTTTTSHQANTKVFASSSYWPEGVVLPAQSSELDDKSDNGSELWISKSRAGYGSHGNQILTFVDVRKLVDDNSEIEMESYLLQHMVDPLMLLDGYKFSLRIYVVLFASDEAYISSKGLVKLASTPLNTSKERDEDRDSILDTKMHMTNSGRETTMRQEDLEFLWKEIGIAEKEELWKDICNVAIDTLLVRYPKHQTNSGDSLSESKQLWKTRRERWGIPKILGLDFVVQNDDDRKRPWLVEVNRFPGLEPRDEDDRTIKYKIVQDAWKKASERIPLSRENPFGFDSTIFDLLGESDTDSSLEQLKL